MERVLHHDRFWHGAGLMLVVALGWLCVVDWPASVIAAGHHEPGAVAGHGVGFWIIMMNVMMLPVVAPAVPRVLGEVRRVHRSPGGVVVFISALLVGYLLVWSAFAILAAWLHVLLHGLTGAPTHGAAVESILVGILLLVAGGYQWSRAKARWLNQCRAATPFADTTSVRVVFARGVLHGLRCLGCCWALMLLMFIDGAMTVPGMVILAGYMLLERIISNHRSVARSAGLLLSIYGVVAAVTAWMPAPAPEWCAANAPGERLETLR